MVYLSAKPSRNLIQLACRGKFQPDTSDSQILHGRHGLFATNDHDDYDQHTHSAQQRGGFLFLFYFATSAGLVFFMSCWEEGEVLRLMGCDW